MLQYFDTNIAIMLGIHDNSYTPTLINTMFKQTEQLEGIIYLPMNHFFLFYKRDEWMRIKHKKK